MRAAMLTSLALGVGVFGSVAVADNMQMTGPMPAAKPADKARIDSALSAGPRSIAAGAAVMAMDAKGAMNTLRAGTNGYTCFPDDPSTPGPDPMCADKSAMEWLNALMAHKQPASGKVGFIYMLAGGTDASNTDPFATKPANGKWVKTGPHVMVVGADNAFYAAYPKGPDPDTSVPYVMWAGTPYQHLMAPVK